MDLVLLNHDFLHLVNGRILQTKVKVNSTVSIIRWHTDRSQVNYNCQLPVLYVHSHEKRYMLTLESWRFPVLGEVSFSI